MKWGIALAGGGTKGSYHIGAWRAVRDLHLEIEAVTGTSIGAVNGALMVSDDFKSALDIWHSVELMDIIRLPADVSENTNLFHFKNMSAIAGEIYKNSGLDVTPYEKLINRYIDEEKVRKSPVEYGLVTFNLSGRTDAHLFKEEIPNGKLNEYIAASSAFPGFKPKKIGESVFLDGGVSNNMPVNMLIKKNCLNILAVDVGGIGIVKGVNKSGRNIVKVRPEENLVGIMDFDHESIENNIDQGYYDTMKAFGVYTGDYFYFNASDYYAARRRFSKDIMLGLESAGRVLGVERFAGYTIEYFIKEVMKLYNKQNKIFDEKFFKFTDEKYIMCCIGEAIIGGNTDLFNNKIVSELSGHVFEGARAIAYFIKSGNIGKA